MTMFLFPLKQQKVLRLTTSQPTYTQTIPIHNQNQRIVESSLSKVSCSIRLIMGNRLLRSGVLFVFVIHFHYHRHHHHWNIVSTANAFQNNNNIIFFTKSRSLPLTPVIRTSAPLPITTRAINTLHAAGDDAANDDENDDGKDDDQTTAAPTPTADAGKLEELKQREYDLLEMLADVRKEKLQALRSRPLSIGVVGFGRFGQFIAKAFAKYSNRVVVTSRSDYTEIANELGVKYIPLDDPEAFVQEDLDVIVFAVSIISFRSSIRNLVPYLAQDLYKKKKERAGPGVQIRGPLIVDVLSVKEHARKTLINLLPPECDILCTHPMFGPDSGKDGWHGLNFVYEKTRIDKVILDHSKSPTKQDDDTSSSFKDSDGKVHSVHEDSEAHVEGMDRMERFLSIWEEEGCTMVPMSCRDHDLYAANSQFITHLVGRTLGNQGLVATPIDTNGFQRVLQLVENTVADSFELFYGLYKYNENSQDTINVLTSSLQDVVTKLKEKEEEEEQWQKEKLKSSRKKFGYSKIDVDSRNQKEEKEQK